ncbi:uncharacterized protein LOC114535648 [Dendronephthya gigantea]|uniref:uncharacterized protein LOC114535648 n=1 Tax=Dendronephthya gigantea TaxID=151771 RepID=UPI00106DC93C|nr:uncharacterized protein LOC114535648 [Dendronephthya gigantea]
MTEREIEGKKSVQIFRRRPLEIFTTVHAIITILLLATMTHFQIRFNNRIAQHEREIHELKELLRSHVYIKSENKLEKAEKKNIDLETEERNEFQYMSQKIDGYKEDNQSNREGNDKRPQILRNKRNTKTSCCARGQKGEKGPKGKRSRGKRGRKGQKGEAGILGAKGDKGDKGLKGDQGFSALSESAHIVGHGGQQRPTDIINRAFILKSWNVSHVKGQMTYSNGYLHVGKTGYYYIYCQLYSIDGNALFFTFSLYIDNKPELRAIKSIINSTRKFDTVYIGGVFAIKAGQKISVRTTSIRLFMYTKTESYFGAFMIHS